MPLKENVMMVLENLIMVVEKDIRNISGSNIIYCLEFVQFFCLLYKELQLKINKNQARALLLNDFIETIDSKPAFLDNFAEDIWNYLVEKAVVNKDKNITFYFRNGQEITKM